MNTINTCVKKVQINKNPIEEVRYSWLVSFLEYIVSSKAFRFS